MSLNESTRETSEPVVVVGSITAGLQFLFGASGVVTLLSGHPDWALYAGIGNCVVSAVQHGLGYWVRGKVTPVADLVQDIGPVATTVDGLPATYHDTTLDRLDEEDAAHGELG